MNNFGIFIQDLSGLYQGADALGAQHLANFTPTFQHSNRLQVGPESPRSCLLGPWAVLTEGRLLATICTLSHFTNSFLTQ